MNLVKDGKVMVEPLITHRFTLNEAPEAYKILQDKTKEFLAVLLDYKKTEVKIPSNRKVQLKPKKYKEGISRMGVIGAGGFAQRQHIPNLLKSTVSTSLVAICARNGANAKKVASIYKAQYCTTDYREILDDPDIDGVIISTLHNTHASIAIDSIKAGKHVLLEKRMAINRYELEELELVARGSNVIFTVGFNRRYAPFASKGR